MGDYRLDDTNYSRWKDYIIFLLSSLKIYYVLDPNLPEILEKKDDEGAGLEEMRRTRKEDHCFVGVPF